MGTMERQNRNYVQTLNEIEPPARNLLTQRASLISVQLVSVSGTPISGFSAQLSGLLCSGLQNHHSSDHTHLYGSLPFPSILSPSAPSLVPLALVASPPIHICTSACMVHHVGGGVLATM